MQDIPALLLDLQPLVKAGSVLLHFGELLQRALGPAPEFGDFLITSLAGPLNCLFSLLHRR